MWAGGIPLTPDAERRPADVVVLGYVVNVVVNPAERREVLQGAYRLARRALVVAARPEWESRYVSGRPYGDGLLTSKGTFQKFFAQDALRSWIDSTLAVQSVAAAPGIFYVFRDDRDAQAFRAPASPPPGYTSRSRLSRNASKHTRSKFEGLCAFLDDRGRLPEPSELSEGSALVEIFGSIRAAFKVISRVTGEERWTRARSEAEKDLLVYLALAAFGKRPKLSDLPDDLQRDVKAFFGSYKEAVSQADRLLFAVARDEEIHAAVTASRVGKVLPDAFCMLRPCQHSSLFRVYEGCSRVLVGTVVDATIVKLQRLNRKVAYLSYPTFDRNAHPPLEFSLRADLRSLDVRYQQVAAATIRRILHRKETFVGLDYLAREIRATYRTGGTRRTT